MKRIYMDHAATTYVNDDVLKEMLPYFSEKFGNPSSLYFYGREAKAAIEKSREQVALAINADVNEIIFTAGGSESDNTIIKSVAKLNKNKGNHIITCAIEHHAVLHTCAQLESDGYEITYLPVNKEGLVSVEDLKNAITDKTILITIMTANNEIGTIQPIEQIGKIAKEHNIVFHTDAVQAIGAVDIDVKKMNIDALSLSAHKFYGPKGIGALYVRKGIKLYPLITGGAQEKNRRAGTEDVAGIVGLGKAIEIATQNINQHNARLTALRDDLIQKLLNSIPECFVNGSMEHRLANNINMCFRYIEGEALLLSLDLKGVAASSGSACTSGSLDPSHVLLALGLPHEVAHGSLRLTLGERTTQEDIDYVAQELPKIVTKLREWSPLYGQE